MSKRDSTELESADNFQPPKKQRLSNMRPSQLTKETSSSSVDMIGQSQASQTSQTSQTSNSKSSGRRGKTKSKFPSSEDDGDQDDDIVRSSISKRGANAMSAMSAMSATGGSMGGSMGTMGSKNETSQFLSISNIGNVSSFIYSQVQSMHILGTNTVELSRSHNDGTEKQMTQHIIQQLTQFLTVSNMQLVVPNIMKSRDSASNQNKSSNNNSTDAVMKDAAQLKQTDTVIVDSLGNKSSFALEESEDNIEEMTRNDEICHNKLSSLLRQNLEASSGMAARKLRKIDIVLEGFKGTRANRFRAQSIINTPTIGSRSAGGASSSSTSNTAFPSLSINVEGTGASSGSGGGSNGVHALISARSRHSGSVASMASMGSLASMASVSSMVSSGSLKNRTDRLICYRDEINEKLFEYTDILLLFPDDNFDVFLNLFEYLRLCELGRTRNTSNPLFSEGIDSMGKVLIFNLNGFYDGLNRQFNCYDEDKVENRFVVVVVDTVQEGIERLKIWNRD